MTFILYIPPSSLYIYTDNTGYTGCASSENTLSLTAPPANAGATPPLIESVLLCCCVAVLTVNSLMLVSLLWVSLYHRSNS